MAGACLVVCSESRGRATVDEARLPRSARIEQRRVRVKSAYRLHTRDLLSATADDLTGSNHSPSPRRIAKQSRGRRGKFADIAIRYPVLKDFLKQSDRPRSPSELLRECRMGLRISDNRDR